MLHVDATEYCTYTSISMSQAMPTELTTLCPLLANPDFRHHPYAQPLNATFADIDLLLFALQIASAMNHLAQRNVSCNKHWHQCTSSFGNSFGKAQLICTLYEVSISFSKFAPKVTANRHS